MGERSHDTIAAVLVAAVCIAYLWGAQGFQSPLVADPLGPSAFPAILGWSGLILAAAQLILTWWGRHPPQGDEGSLRSFLKPLVLFGLLVAYAFALEPAGYLLATFTFVLISFSMLGEPLWRGALIAAGFSGGFYYVFVHILKINLPAGEIFRLISRG
jgi:putative tricarboxylic transport membrane protein